MISIVITSSNYTEWQIQAEWNLNIRIWPNSPRVHLSLTGSANTYWQQGCRCDSLSFNCKKRWLTSGAEEEHMSGPPLNFPLLFTDQYLMARPQLTLMSWRASVNCVRGYTLQREGWNLNGPLSGEWGSNVMFSQYLASYCGNQY